MTILLVTSMTRYISESELRAWEDSLNKFSIIEPNVSSINNNELAQLRSNEQVKEIFAINESIIKIPGILNSEYRPIFAMQNSEMNKFLNLLDSKLVSGKLPKSNERGLILTEDIINYKGIEIGGYVGKAIDEEEFLWGRFEIEGKIKSDISFGIASLDYFQRKLSSTNTKYLVLPSNSIEQLNKSLEKNTNYNIRNLSNLIQSHNEKYSNLNRLILVITIVLIISLIIITGLFMKIYLNSRNREFALYFSNGISVKSIILFVVKEISIMALLSITLGILLSKFFLLFLKEILFQEGVFLVSLSLDEYILIVPIGLSILVSIYYILKSSLKAEKLEKIILGDY